MGCEQDNCKDLTSSGQEEELESTTTEKAIPKEKVSSAKKERSLVSLVAEAVVNGVATGMAFPSLIATTQRTAALYAANRYALPGIRGEKTFEDCARLAIDDSAYGLRSVGNGCNAALKWTATHGYKGVKQISEATVNGTCAAGAWTGRNTMKAFGQGYSALSWGVQNGYQQTKWATGAACTGVYNVGAWTTKAVGGVSRRFKIVPSKSSQ